MRGRYSPPIVKETIYFENAVQATLWNLELSGQISDGQWENAIPYNHWQYWACRPAEVGDPSNNKKSYAKKYNYNFTNGEFLSCVGGRMIVYAKMALLLGRPVSDIEIDQVNDIPKDPELAEKIKTVKFGKKELKQELNRMKQTIRAMAW